MIASLISKSVARTAARSILAFAMRHLAVFEFCERLWRSAVLGNAESTAVLLSVATMNRGLPDIEAEAYCMGMLSRVDAALFEI
jgi:hypothetical protein